ncbi:hypothetical protein L218DRAFT_132516 [Marasmius fiardii PR-910]|nr:hypothetical protein L218DRAFT_132516 [Marasmius fiardii PR-910]
MLMGPSPAKHPLIHEPILYITNLPASISDQSVADHCRASHVWFDELTIERESNEETVSGTIEFYQVEMAEKAHAILQSRPLSEINPPVHLILSPYPPENSLLDEPPRTTAILVQNLPHGYPESALYNLFRPLGAIDWVWIRTYSGHDTGVVEFWSEDDAYRASRELNGTEVEGQKISIRFPTSGFLTPQRSYSTHRRWSAIYDHPVDESSLTGPEEHYVCLS